MNEEKILQAIERAMDMLEDFALENDIEIRGTLAFTVGEQTYIEQLTIDNNDTNTP